MRLYHEPMPRTRARAAVLAGISALLIAPPSSAPAAQGDWILASPIFTPKAGTSFTTLFTNFQPFSRPMLLRRYDAVGTLLTSQQISIGAKGSLQASPAAHSGAPLHIEIWTEHPGLRMLITYLDAGDVSRRIEPGDMELVGPAYATAAGVDGDFAELSSDVAGVSSDVTGVKSDVAGVQSSVGALTNPLNTLQTGVSGLQAQLSSVATDVVTVKTDVAGTPAKLDKLQSDLTAANTKLGTPVVDVPDPRIDRLQKSVTGLRRQVKGLRRILKKALAQRG